ncbi:MAG TPA: 50S ribosomal protein L30 [Thermoanaerobaculia bacterium]|nr:50S ribosomal protein L30 [Thermoanaerobaculia bacterium]
MTARRSDHSRPPAGQRLRIQQVRSAIGSNPRQRETLRTLGLRRIREIVERDDTPAVRGAVAKIPHLVRIVEDER